MLKLKPSSKLTYRIQLNGCNKQHPQTSIEVWAFDEHRLGLKPIVRTVWSPVGKRPVAPVNHQQKRSFAR